MLKGNKEQAKITKIFQITGVAKVGDRIVSIDPKPIEKISNENKPLYKETSGEISDSDAKLRQ